MEMALNFMKRLLARNASSAGIYVSRLRYTTAANDSEKPLLTFVEEDEETKLAREQDIQKKRNKSRLYPDHYAMYHGINPYPTAEIEYHKTLRFKRRTFGRCGEASGIDPSALWPTKAELANKKEYEAVAFPYTIPEMVENIKQRKAEELKIKNAREANILTRVAKVEQGKQDFHNKVKKKAEEAAAARERKDRLVEEIRRHFGYKIDPKDERFREMLEKKEKEAKKLNKAAKQKVRDMQMLEKAVAQAADEDETTAKANAADDEDSDDEQGKKKK